jgi:hypothetical protein
MSWFGLLCSGVFAAIGLLFLGGLLAYALLGLRRG